MWNLSFLGIQKCWVFIPIGSMGLVYLPPYTVTYHKHQPNVICQSHGSVTTFRPVGAFTHRSFLRAIAGPTNLWSPLMAAGRRREKEVRTVFHSVRRLVV